MIALLANGQRKIECNICHGVMGLDAEYQEITSEIHVCPDCQSYQAQPVSFFAWYVLLERLYKEDGREEIPRSGRYAEDWPIRYYNQGFTPENAMEAMEMAINCGT